MKRNKRIDISTGIAIASFLLSTACLVWVGGFRFSELLSEVEGLSTRVDKLEDNMNMKFEKLEMRMDKFENRMDNFQTELDKHDIRLTTIEHRKP